MAFPLWWVNGVEARGHNGPKNSKRLDLARREWPQCMQCNRTILQFIPAKLQWMLSRNMGSKCYHIIFIHLIILLVTISLCVPYSSHSLQKHLHGNNTPLKHVTSMRMLFSITKTCLYNFDPLKPHFYIVKLGFTRVYIIFLIFLSKT